MFSERCNNNTNTKDTIKSTENNTTPESESAQKPPEADETKEVKQAKILPKTSISKSSSSSLT